MDQYPGDPPPPPQPSYQPQPSGPMYPQQQPYPQQQQQQHYPAQPYAVPGSYPYQQPPPPPPQPYYVQPMQPVAPIAMQYTRNTSFTMKAVVAFLLYFLFWVPGVIFNIMFLNEANNVKRELGRTPEGYGCLIASLVWAVVPLGVFAWCAISILVGLIGASSGAGGGQ